MQAGPGLGGLAVAVGHHDQLLGAVRAHALDDQHAGLRLRRADPQVDAVGPHVDVVRGRQVALAECLVIGLPLRRQPGDRGGRETGGRAEKLLRRRHEVPRRQAVQVKQGQHLADLRGRADPGRQDRRGEPPALTGGLVDALVVDPRSLHLDRPGRGHDLPRLMEAVAHDQTPPGLVPLIGQLGCIRVGFRLQRGGHHPPCALADDVVNEGAVWCCSVFVDHREHGRVFSTDAWSRSSKASCAGRSARRWARRGADGRSDRLAAGRARAGPVHAGCGRERARRRTASTQLTQLQQPNHRRHPRPLGQRQHDRPLLPQDRRP